jgi:hypothetical protein
VSEKSKGVLIFATNTKEIDYIKIAKINAKLIKKYLGLPTTIVSGTKSSNKRRVDNEIVEWQNTGRCEAYDLSPYDQTILVDGDYLIFDSNLLKVLDTVQDYAIVDKNTYVNKENLVDTLGQLSIGPMLWATVIVFNKTQKSKDLFEFAKMIQNNYPYYRALYKLQTSNFRNDAAFTIADRLVNGYVEDTSTKIPWSIQTIQGKVNQIIIDDWIKVITDDGAYVLPYISLHFHDKQYLQSIEFEEVLNA